MTAHRIKEDLAKAGIYGAGVGTNPDWLKLKDTAGEEYYLLVDTDGKLRITTTNPTESTTPNSLGTVVGSQS